MLRLKSCPLVLAALLLCAGGARAQAGAEPARDDPHRATVRIMAGEFDAGRVFRRKGSASGVIVSAEGHVLTARHAVFAGPGPGDLHPEIWAGLADPRQGRPLPNRAVRLRFVAADPKSDLALFQIQPAAPRRAPARYPFLRLATNLDLAYGDALSVVSYPHAGSPQSFSTRVGVVELDEMSDWIKVEGELLQGAAGGAAVNARRELVGIPVAVSAQTVTLFDEENVPVGRIELERVGMLRSAEAIARFLGEALRDKFPQAANGGFKLDALVVDERTRRPIPGATIGVLTPEAASPEFYVAADELLSYGRSDGKGECVLSRRLPTGRYIVKVVHPNYETEIAEVSLTPNADRLVIKMRPSPR